MKYLKVSHFIVPILVIGINGVANAQSAAAADLSFPQRLIAMMPMVAIIFGIFYFMVIMPQRKQEQQHGII